MMSAKEAHRMQVATWLDEGASANGHGQTVATGNTKALDRQQAVA